AMLAEHNPGFSATIFAESLSYLRRIPDREFTAYGATALRPSRLTTCGRASVAGSRSCDNGVARTLPLTSSPQRLDSAAEEHLGLGQLPVVHRAELHVAEPIAALQLAGVHDEDPVLTCRNELHDLLAHKTVRGREALFEEVGLADVIVLRTGEHVVVG